MGLGDSLFEQTQLFMSSHTPTDREDNHPTQDASNESGDRPTATGSNIHPSSDSDAPTGEPNHEILLTNDDPYEVTVISTTDTDIFVVTTEERSEEWCANTLTLDGSEVTFDGCMNVLADEIDVDHTASVVNINLS